MNSFIMSKSLYSVSTTNLPKASCYLITGFEAHLCLLQVLSYFHLNHITLKEERKPCTKAEGEEELLRP